MISPIRRQRRPLVSFGIFLCACAAHARAYDANDWPTYYRFADGTELGFSGNYEWDYNNFSNLEGLTSAQQATFPDSTGTRREALNLYLEKAGVYDANFGYDFASKLYLNVFVRFQSRAFLARDYGAFTFGYSKSIVGFEGYTSSASDSFLERAMVIQAFYQGRRSGTSWRFERPEFILDLGGDAGQDLQGNNDGRSIGGRAAWTPLKETGKVLHLGLVASEQVPVGFVQNDEENPQDSVDQSAAHSTRLRARPDVFLTSTRLVDTGTIKNVDRIDLRGLEGLWIDGPWSVQGEYLSEDVARSGGLATISSSGAYLFGSWVVTGESRPYSKGNVGNLKPGGSWGAVELLFRYDELDLNDPGAGIHGGKEHNWTLGANWYIATHFRLQANYIWAHESGNPAFNKGGPVDPKIFGLRAQVYF
jgi:phosphate-selective porin OprO and OprP